VFVGNRPAPDAFRAELLRVGRSVLLAVDGELDLATSRQLRAATDGIDDPLDPPDVTVDLSRLEFVDAAGVAALVELRNAVHDAGGGIHLRSARPNVRRVLELVELVDLLDAGGAQP